MFYAYVDETGDRGLSAKSSPYFSLAAVVVSRAEAWRVINYPQTLRSAIKRQMPAKLKWTDLPHHERRVAAQTVAALPINIIYVCIAKAGLPRGSGLSDSEKFYNYAVRLLVERLSWYGERHSQQVAIWFERVRGFNHQSTTDYLNRLRSQGTTIKWDSVGRITVTGPKQVSGLICADHVAGMFDSATRPHAPTGLVEERYLVDVSARIDRGPTNKLEVYGIKVMGDLSHLPWWGTL